MDAIPQPADFVFSCQFEVRFRDLDAMGHVNNAVYLAFFENARAGYMRALGHRPSTETSMAALFPFILADIRCRFLAPGKLGDLVLAHLRTCRIGGKSFEFEYLLTRHGDNVPLAWGRSTQVYYDYGAQQTRSIPSSFRRCIEQLER